MSKGHPKSGMKGLGYNYVEAHRDWHIANMDDNAKLNGFRMKLPRYFKDEIWPVNNLLKTTVDYETGEIEEIGRRKVSDSEHELNDYLRLQMRMKSYKLFSENWEEAIQQLAEREPDMTYEELEKELLHRKYQRARNNLSKASMGLDKLDY